MRVRVVHLLVIVLLAASAAAAERIDRVLAVVGGRVITESDVRAALSFGLVSLPRRPDADPVRITLDQLIRRELILTELANAAVPEPDAAVVAKRLDAIRERFPSAAAYQAKLAETGMDEARLRDSVASALRVDDYVRQRFAAVAEPSEEEVSAYYKAHQAEFASGGQPMTDEARAAIRQRLIEERRNQAVEDWITRLRRRTEVTDLYFAG